MSSVQTVSERRRVPFSNRSPSPQYFGELLSMFDASRIRAEDVKRADKNTRGNLPGFEVDKVICDKAIAAYVKFEQGNVAEAVELMLNAIQHLANAQDAYSRNGLLKRFCERYRKMSETQGISSDEIHPVETLLDEYEELVSERIRDNESISNCAWAIEDAFAQARKQYDGRMTAEEAARQAMAIKAISEQHAATIAKIRSRDLV